MHDVTEPVKDPLPPAIFRAPTGEPKKNVIYAEPLLHAPLDKQANAIGEANICGVPFMAKFILSNKKSYKVIYFDLTNFYRELFNHFKNDPQGSVKIIAG